jgi:hypothetical protein
VAVHEAIFGFSPSRRAIVKSGVKLAYAAPLVAASMKVGAASAQTVSTGNPDPVCQGAVCSSLQHCAGSSSCFCFQTSAGGGYCAVSTECAGLSSCPNGQPDCPDGTICTPNTCCGATGVCQPLTLHCAEANGAGVDSVGVRGPGTTAG